MGFASSLHDYSRLVKMRLDFIGFRSFACVLLFVLNGVDPSRANTLSMLLACKKKSYDYMAIAEALECASRNILDSSRPSDGLPP